MEKQIRTPYHSQFRKELIGHLDQAIDRGIIDYDKACTALDAYDAGLIGEFILDQQIVRPREEGYGQLRLVESEQLELPDGIA